jgi:hypothetical protein
MRKESWLLALLFLALFGALAAKNSLEQAPSLRAQDSPGEFNAIRAKARVATILGDQRPHPGDSDAGDQVRSRLVASLEQLGLKPIVRDQFACNELFKQRGVSCARVRNVIAMLGLDTGKALLLNAHYDSVPIGPGASDDGMGVATLLEVASILKDRPLRRPVILLFNEGEELGLLGARAFLADPLSRNVDSLINLEARGVRGPVNMFETSRPNAAPIDLFAAAVKNPVANSLSADVYRLMPNYTDVNSFAERGWLTLNLATIGNETRYHSGGDNLAALDPATLQHMGDQTLALAEGLAGGTPKAEDGERIFMDVAGHALVNLPLPVGAVLLIALFNTFLVLSIRNGGLPVGMAVVAGTFIGSGMISWVVLALIGVARRGEFWRAEPIWTHLGAYASAMFVGAALLASIGKGATGHQLRTAYWLFLLGLGGLIGLLAPGGVIFFIFPPLLALIGTVAARWWRPAELLGSIAAILFLYVTWGGMLGLLEELLDNGPMWLFAPLASFIILPVLIETKPLIQRVGLRQSGAIAGLLVLASWAGAAAVPAYSADRQQRFVIEQVTDASERKSWWSLLNDGAPVPNAFPGRWTRGKLPFSDRPRWLSPDPADPSAKTPQVQLLSEVRAGDERTLTIRLRANGNDSISLIAPEDARVFSAGAAGFVRPMAEGAAGKFSIGCSGRSCDGAVLQLTTGRVKPVPFVLVGSRAALPASAAPLLAARPGFARPQYNPDESITFARVNL